MIQWFVNFFYERVQVWSRVYSTLHKWANSAVVAIRERRFGKLFSWSFLLALTYTVSDFIKIGVNQTIELFHGVSNNASLLEGSSLLTWASQSLQPVEQYLSNLIPPFWRWLGWWMGFDWLLWSVVCTVILAFCGWLLSIFIKGIASIIRLVFQFI